MSVALGNGIGQRICKMSVCVCCGFMHGYLRSACDIFDSGTSFKKQRCSFACIFAYCFFEHFFSLFHRDLFFACYKSLKVKQKLSSRSTQSNPLHSSKSHFPQDFNLLKFAHTSFQIENLRIFKVAKVHEISFFANFI